MYAWLYARSRALVEESRLWRAVAQQGGQAEWILILLLAFVIALIITGRRVVVQ